MLKLGAKQVPPIAIGGNFGAARYRRRFWRVVGSEVVVVLAVSASEIGFGPSDVALRTQASFLPKGPC